jgi:hypothetical protein
MVSHHPHHQPPQLGGVTCGGTTGGGGFEHAPVLNAVHVVQLNVH